jgi:SAM-dependent methyltransferase
MAKAVLWASPVYRFRIPAARGKVKEVVIDVTSSAPSFSDPGRTLSNVFNQVFDYLKIEKDEKVNRILDFGAGKLRNTLFFLKKDYYVTAVEYEKLSRESSQAQEMLADAGRFRTRFKELVFPHEFISSSGKYDVILLVNVLNIMPVPSERLMVLQECHKKLREGGHLFWYTQYGDASYISRCTKDKMIGDGYYVGENRKFKSFYREFSVSEIDEMLSMSGFVFEKLFPVSHNRARLYQKGQSNPTREMVSAATIERHSTFDRGAEKPTEKKPIVRKLARSEKFAEPNPPELSPIPEKVLTEKLRGIRPGREGFKEYQETVKLIFARVFEGMLDNIRSEEQTFEGKERIDLVATNIDDRRFFWRLSSKLAIRCLYIPIECKNYTSDPGNAEFNQIASRFDKKTGVFGFLVYRTSKDKLEILEHCRRRLNKDQGYIIPLDDDDLIELLALTEERKDREIDNLLDTKLWTLLGRKDKE